MACGNNDPLMVLSRRTKLPRKRLEMAAIVGQERHVLPGSVGKLSEIASAQTTCIACGYRHESARPKEVRHHDVHVFVEIKLDEKVSHNYLTKGSINSSGMRLCSM